MIIDIFKYLKCIDNILSTVHILSLHNSSKRLVLYWIKKPRPRNF